MIKILIADDHPVVRFGLKHMLSRQKDLAIIGEAGGAAEVVMMIQEMNPDVVVLDMEMSDSRGVEALQRVRSVAPKQRVIIYTSHDSGKVIVEATGLGVEGYLLKDSGPNELAKAIRCVHNGGIYLEPRVAEKLVKGMHATPGSPMDPLTPRELDVLRRMARGFRNQAIADALYISERTAKYHVSAILTKLGAANRTEAVTLAIDLGLLSADETLNRGPTQQRASR